MKFAQIREMDVANGPGIRVSFFVTGCRHHCPYCFNKEYQDFNFGQNWTEFETALVIKYLQAEFISGLTILGGEPFQNELELLPILRKIKLKMRENQSIWIYSGYTWEQINADNNKKALLLESDVLVDGLFINDLKDLRLKFRGSSNQRIIDVKKSCQSNSIVLCDI